MPKDIANCHAQWDKIAKKKWDSVNPNPFPLKGNIFENVWSLDEVKKDFFDQHYSLNFFPFLAHFLYRRGYNQ